MIVYVIARKLAFDIFDCLGKLRYVQPMKTLFWRLKLLNVIVLKMPQLCEIAPSHCPSSNADLYMSRFKTPIQNAAFYHRCAKLRYLVSKNWKGDHQLAVPRFHLTIVLLHRRHHHIQKTRILRLLYLSRRRKLAV